MHCVREDRSVQLWVGLSLLSIESRGRRYVFMCKPYADNEAEISRKQQKGKRKEYKCTAAESHQNKGREQEEKRSRNSKTVHKQLAQWQ